MTIFLLAIVTESERMPLPPQIAFIVMGIVLLLVTLIRSWQSRSEWKAKSSQRQRTPYRLSAAMRLEISLVTVGWMICWAVADPDWRFRILFGGTALLGIVVTLYRARSESKQSPTFDDASVLHVKS